MKGTPLPRLDRNPALRERLLPLCRLRAGEVWTDPEDQHRVGCLDAADPAQMARLAEGRPATLAVQDPPYNLVAFHQQRLDEYVTWCRRWVEVTLDCMAPDAGLYVWLGADQRHGFGPLPDFMIMMRDQPLETRSFVTLRNQRGYGTQKNWMAVRQELLVYTRGAPPFTVQYTDIPKILRGYYKEVDGRRTENTERGRGKTIRPGNVWVDVQQVFYRLEENVSGCYAQKPLPAIERIVAAASNPGDVVLDSFAHSGTTLLACERLGRRTLTADIDPVYCELTIRRLEQYRATGQLGWQNSHAFEAELGDISG
jgi:DNA methylase